MGLAIAEKLAASGYRLALMARSAEVEAVAQRLGGIAVRGSVADLADLTRLVEATVSSYGRIDAVVNNSGHPPSGELLAIADEDWHAALDLILLNVVRMARLTAPVMIGGGGGAFVNISTTAAREPDARFPLSGTLRAGLAHFAKMFIERYAVDGIRMNNILPGKIDSWPQPPEQIARVPARRMGRTGEVADVAAFLLSDEASYINGQSLLVDGGLLRGV
jgi:NAD(P)-dependent dehydrogenase (short-subunit alcohol dehydrogenase family)